MHHGMEGRFGLCGIQPAGGAGECQDRFRRATPIAGDHAGFVPQQAQGFLDPAAVDEKRGHTDLGGECIAEFGRNSEFPCIARSLFSSIQVTEHEVSRRQQAHGRMSSVVVADSSGNGDDFLRGSNCLPSAPEHGRPP